MQIAKTFGCCRFVYNRTLAYRKETYEKEKKYISRINYNNYCNRELKKKYGWLKEVDKFALTNAIYNMDSAYQKFFKEHTGYPKFRNKHSNHKSYTTNFTNGNIVVDFEDRKIKTFKVKKGKGKNPQGICGADKICYNITSAKWEILCVSACGNRTRGAAAYKPEDRTGFRHKRFMYYIRWEKVRKSKDNKKIWEKTGKAAKEAGAQREREQ